MKKIVLAVSSALVAAAMLFAFVGCGDKAVDNNNTQADVSNAVVEVESNSVA